ncbi:MAG: 4-(cytidine 5'-diphospho)-2-C-methyl-D-erythritol kinase [candidate division WOR-3 bacterium]|nr:4-(cytidine 5'-diphospho)-2-C-methyl-D-erythritol kinase [candidate division WOR-3 bacterium]
MIKIIAPAKINIGLTILGKRPDGYHNIETTLSTISLSDKIFLEKAEKEIEIVSPGLKIPKEENLCYKAARLFLNTFEINSGIKITLQKNIPIGGGLGGGSTDAAGVLKGMREVFNQNISDEELMNLSRNLGCDVPFFIKGGAAIARGVGDELKFFKLPKMKLIIYYPGYPISTKWAYEEYDKSILTSGIEVDNILLEKKKKSRTGMNIVNDFEKIVFKAHPDLLDVKTNLLNAGAYMVSLTGSGSCLYAVVDDNIKKKVIKYLSGIGAMYFEAETV